MKVRDRAAEIKGIFYTYIAMNMYDPIQAFSFIIKTKESRMGKKPKPLDSWFLVVAYICAKKLFLEYLRKSIENKSGKDNQPQSRL